MPQFKNIKMGSKIYLINFDWIKLLNDQLLSASSDFKYVFPTSIHELSTVS